LTLLVSSDSMISPRTGCAIVGGSAVPTSTRSQSCALFGTLTVATLTRWLVFAGSAGTLTVHCIELPCCIIVSGLPKLASTKNVLAGALAMPMFSMSASIVIDGPLTKNLNFRTCRSGHLSTRRLS